MSRLEILRLISNLQIFFVDYIDLAIALDIPLYNVLLA